MNDIWYALDYQDRRISKLVEENKHYKQQLKHAEKKLDAELADVHKQIEDIK